jgi:NAD(P)H-quinone oxidoreductase subunit 5
MFAVVKEFFNFDAIALLMVSLSLFTGMCVMGFSWRYMKGDNRFRIFFVYITLLIGSIVIMTIANHILLFYGAWCLGNLFLVRLMVHKTSWVAAKNSGLLAGKNYLIGALSIAAALFLLYLYTGETSITTLVKNPPKSPVIYPIVALLFLGAMTQSAIWPCHRWLISSLNSPTPVSAIMHAGLVNGGGFLLARFAPLYFEIPNMLAIVFIIGMISALLGTFWKLIQCDVKSTLACSTMGQMGFMFVQCGLGLFPCAIAHLMTHGMFKAYLFLSSGTAAQEKRYDKKIRFTFSSFSCALFCGVIGSLCFSLTSGKSWITGDSTIVLMTVVLISAVQGAISLLTLRTRFRMPVALLFSSIMYAFYGLIVSLMTNVMKPMEIMQPQSLQFFHIGAIGIMVLSWLLIVLFKNTSSKKSSQPWILKTYVMALNASQPHPSTVTAHRNHYKYQ